VYLLGADEVPGSAIPKNAFVVYQGHHGDHGAYFADIVLPSACYTEKNATYINTEGRAQRTRAAVTPLKGAREDWKIVRAISEVVGARLPYDNIEQLHQRMAEISPVLVDYGEPQQLSKDQIRKGLAIFGKYQQKPIGTPYTLGISDFYMTNSIARSSPTMAKCSQVLLCLN
jgi:NADH dehydrogenase (ubiquinone) Fe-S protein 1